MTLRLLKRSYPPSIKTFPLLLYCPFLGDVSVVLSRRVLPPPAIRWEKLRSEPRVVPLCRNSSQQHKENQWFRLYMYIENACLHRSVHPSVGRSTEASHEQPAHSITFFIVNRPGDLGDLGDKSKKVTKIAHNSHVKKNGTEKKRHLCSHLHNF